MGESRPVGVTQMETTFSVRLISVKNVSVDEADRLRWDVIVTVAVVSPFGRFDLDVEIDRSPTIDDAVSLAMTKISEWGAEFGEASQIAPSRKAQT